MRALALACLTAAVALAAAPPQGGSGEDEALLRSNGIATDGPGLLAYLKKHYTAATEAQIKALIEDLGDDDFEKREAASRALVGLGVRARPFLKAALGHPDLEVRSRAARCLKEAEAGGVAVMALTAAAVRRVGWLRPRGVVEALLDAIEAEDDEAMASEVTSALAEAGALVGKADPLLVKALTSSPKRRAAAGVALARAGASLPEVRKLLDDRESSIRARVALALLERGEREALATLAGVMGEPSLREAGIAEEVLCSLAGEKSPSLRENTPAARKAYREAWQQWVKDHGPRADLGILKERARLAGITTVVLLDAGEVLDLDASNRVRWRITGLQKPLDVQRLSGERVLLAEHDGGRVTERDSKGVVLWQHKAASPLAAQRLPNGNTFITTKKRLIEVDPKGNEVWSYSRPLGEDFKRARRLPGGDILAVVDLGVSRLVRINRFGTDLSSFGVEVYTIGGRVDLTPSGTVLIPEMHNNKVTERTLDGTVVREIKVPMPITAFSLPNGNVLITSILEKRAVEVARSGKEVWEYRRDTRVTRAVRY
jgi:HEAT repeat protein